MLVQRFNCLPGGDVVTFGKNHEVAYHFTQAGPGEPFLCEITDEAHLKRLAEIPEGYRLYDVGEVPVAAPLTLEQALAPAIPEDPVVLTHIPMDGEIFDTDLPGAEDPGVVENVPHGLSTDPIEQTPVAPVVSEPLPVKPKHPGGRPRKAK